MTFWAVQALAVRTNGNGSQLHTNSYLHLGPPAAADSPAVPGWAGEVLHRSIPTSTSRNFDYFFRMFNEGSFKFFAIRIRSR